MKRLALLLALLVTAVSSPAIVISNYYSLNASLPDGDLNGWQNTQTIAGYDGLTVGDVNVGLNISGTWNGDLYGYLTHSSGTVILLNRVGKTPENPAGFINDGFSILLDDSAANSINSTASGGSYSVNTMVSGVYQPMGTLASFNGSAVNGDWTLYLVDFAAGDTHTLNSWSLVITAVPEPTTWAAIIFGGVFGGAQLLRWRRRKA